MPGETDLHDFRQGAGSPWRQGLPPIVGLEGGSAWFGSGGHVTSGGEPLPSIEAGMYVHIDVQPDAVEPAVVLGSETRNASTLRVKVNDPAPGDIDIYLRGENGDRLHVVAHGSPAFARRVTITGTPSQNRLTVVENQPWATRPGAPLPIDVVVAEAPQQIRLRDFSVAGIRVDGDVSGRYVGRLSEVALGPTEPP